jgi:hypothetical protein
MTDSTDELRQLRLDLKERDKEIVRLKAEAEKTAAELADASGKLKDVSGKLKNATLTLRMSDAMQRISYLPDPEKVADLVGRAVRDGEWSEDTKGRLRREDQNGFHDESVYDWLQKERVKPDAAYYFADGQMTGNQTPTDATNGTASRAGQGREVDAELMKIFDPKNMNLTKASEIYRDNPELAARIAKQVGNKIFDRIEAQDRRFGR